MYGWIATGIAGLLVLFLWNSNGKLHEEILSVGTWLNKSIDDMNAVNVQLKDLVSKNFNDLKATNIDEFKPKLYSTGGTSGKHFHFFNEPFR